MAILVSNPSTVQFTGAPTEPQDPATTPLDAGFTEELANAMQPTGQDADGQNAATKPPLPVMDAKSNDLQILPPDVLLNAVGEANFALGTQGKLAPTEGALIKDAAANTAENLLSDTTDSTQAAEMAAAALAAQMSAAMSAAMSAPVPVQNTEGQPASITVQVEATTSSLSALQALTPAGSPSVDAIETAAPDTASVQASSVNLVNANSATSTQIPSAVELQALKNSKADAALNQLTQSDQVSNGQNIEASPVAIETQTIEVVQATSRVLSADTQTIIPSADQQLQAQAQPTQQFAESAQLQQVSQQVFQAQVNPSNANGNPKGAVDNVVQIQNGLASDIAANSEPTPSVPSEVGIPQSAFGLAQIDVAKTGVEVSANSGQNSTIVQALDSHQTVQAGLAIDVGSEVQGMLAPSEIALNASSSTSQPSDLAVKSMRDAPQETSFKFDAKLGAQPSDDPTLLKAKLAAPVSLGGDQGLAGVNGTALPISLNASATPNEAIVQNQERTGQSVDPTSALNATTSMKMGATPDALKTASDASKIQDIEANESMLASSKRSSNISEKFDDSTIAELAEQPSGKPSAFAASASFSAGLDATRSTQNNRVNSASGDADAVNALAALSASGQPAMAENVAMFKPLSDDLQSSAKSFSDVSSTFVNTLVGGPQRPITTVMDWVALKPQEPPKPVMPHELRLDAGAVQVEIQRMVKQGGGHVVMELTPPDQSKFTIELKLDEKGGAYLKVDGVSDSTKTRLEQSAPQLEEQFQQMGLNLQLDMSQNRDSSQTSASDWAPNEPRFDNTPNQEATPQTLRAVTAERARKNNGGQVYLYA